MNRTLIITIANAKEKRIMKDDGTSYSMGYECIDTSITFYRFDKKFKYVMIPDSVLHIIHAFGVPYDENDDNIKSFDLHEIEVTEDNVNDDNILHEIHLRLSDILNLMDYKQIEDKSLYELSEIVANDLYNKLKGKYM